MINKLPNSLLDLIGTYGAARTDGVAEVERLFMWSSMIQAIRAYAQECVEVERERCVMIIINHKIPVGNSPAGEMAAEWTLDALREVRDMILEAKA